MPWMYQISWIAASNGVDRRIAVRLANYAIMDNRREFRGYIPAIEKYFFWRFKFSGDESGLLEKSPR